MNKQPLYRKVNSKARGCHHNTGPDAKYERNTKQGMSTKMKKGVQRGLDYTPLYKFLLSKIGQDWDKIHSEAVSRLDREEPIYHLVAKQESDKRLYHTCGESSYYSGLYVAEDNTLQKVEPRVVNEHFTPSCNCCTHTFNGNVFVRKYKDGDFYTRFPQPEHYL